MPLYILNTNAQKGSSLLINTNNPQRFTKQRLLSIKQTTDEYGASDWFWRSRIWGGELPYVKVGHKQLLDRNDLDHFIQQHKTVELATN